MRLSILDLGPVHHRGSASIGVVAFDGSESGAEELIRRADIAMYEAKSGGRNGISLFDPASLGFSQSVLGLFGGAQYFPSFGFEKITRDEVPACLRVAEEFASACPASATVMRLMCGEKAKAAISR